MAYSKNENKPKGTVPEKDPVSDLLVKTVKTFEELEEDVEKIKKVMCKQSRNIKGERKI